MPLKVTEDILPGPVADVASSIVCKVATLPPEHNVATTVIPTIGNVGATPEHPLYSHPEEQKMVTLGTDINPESNKEEEGTSIKARKVRKHF